MNTLHNANPRATQLSFQNDLLEVHLDDGRILSVPLEWYPRLQRATVQQRKNFEWLGRGLAIHWSDIDEDVEIDGLLRGVRAPQSKAYLEGIWSDEITRQTEEVEAKDRANRTLLRAPRKKAVKAKN